MLLSCGKNPSTTDEIPETITDIDGNIYHTVQIGNQVWTVENLRVTHYNDGSPIPRITDNSTWENNTSGAYCYYNNDSAANAEKYGALYNGHAEYTGKLAPKGWHVPTNEEWTELVNYLILNGYNWDGTTDTTENNKVGKSMATKTDWASSDVEGNVGNDISTNNRSGFSALPGGYRLYDGNFNNQGYYGYWLSATKTTAPYAYYRYLYNDSPSLWRRIDTKYYGYSVRLLMD